MESEHLIMFTAQLVRFHGALTVKAWTTDYLSCPTVVGRAAFPKALVMHQAESSSRVRAITVSNGAWRSHDRIITCNGEVARYRALGNAVTCSVSRWIGARIKACHEA